MEFLLSQRYAEAVIHGPISKTIIRVAKPKNRPAPRKKNPSKANADSSDGGSRSDATDRAHEQSVAPDQSESSMPLAPIARRPMLFKIALVLFIGWLIYLAYIAYVVLS